MIRRLICKLLHRQHWQIVRLAVDNREMRCRKCREWHIDDKGLTL